MRIARAFLLFFLALPALAQPFNATKLDELDYAIERAIAQKKIPGGVLRIERGDSVHKRVYGNRALVPAVEKMTEDTIFDAASITKVVATAPSIWILIERGKLGIDDPVKKHIAEMADGEITVRHLLTHTSGLRPSLDRRDNWRGYDEGIRRALAQQPLNRPGRVFRYSDVNYIILGELVRRVSGDPLDVFAAREIFEPLGMKDTRFRPAMSERIAPTELVDGRMLRGVVHDPTARAMDGVAGSAGVFTTAADLAIFARAVLAGRFPRGLTAVESPAAVDVRRAGGFDIDSAYSRPRGDHFPIGSFGHTGWTGGFLWIDPFSRSFYVFLSNRVHPDGKGSVTALQREVGTLVAESIRGFDFDHVAGALPQRAGGRVQWITGGADAQNGIDVLHASGYAALRGMRVGLITNHTGIDRAGNPTIDLLSSAPEVQLVALFSPEHGLQGVADEKIGDGSDPVTKLPVYSLYGERRKPSMEQLKGLDALVFDIQDIGTRFYTYISTMGLAMEAAAEAKIKFVVLDRANPIGGEIVEGPMLEGETDFIAWHSLPVRHGMTVGELAKMFRAERKIDVDLTVVEVRGWSRAMWQDEAGLPWINTSPNMRSLNAAALYPGIGILERAISVGRGTPSPFEILGAPYIDAHRLAKELGDLPGVALTVISFIPTTSVFEGKKCHGLAIRITDRKKLRPVTLGLTIAATLARLYPQQFPVDDMKRLLRDSATLETIRKGEVPKVTVDPAFLERRAKYLLY